MKHSIVFASALVLAACGDNIHPLVDGGRSDVPVTSSPITRAVIVAGDFRTTGILTTLDPETLAVTTNVAAGVAGSDPYLRQFDGQLYVVNRAGGSNVTIVDGASYTLIEQLATGAGSNPQDVAVHGNKLYVPALGTTGVVVLTRGTATRTTIDLGTALGDPDGHPDCVSAYAVGDDIYVACDLLDQNFVPRGPGKVAVIDTATDTVRATVVLPFANPQNMFVRTPATSKLAGDLLIPTVPGFTAPYTTGCLARVAVGAMPKANGCAVMNSEVDGFQAHADVQVQADGAASLWMAVSKFDAQFNASGKLMRFDLATGTLDPTALSPASEDVVDVAVCPDGRIVIADRPAQGATGLRIYRGTSEVTTAPIVIGLPPSFGNNLVCYQR